MYAVVVLMRGLRQMRKVILSVSFRLKEEDVEVSQTVCSHRSSRLILHSIISSSLYEGSIKPSGQYSADSVASLAS